MDEPLAAVDLPFVADGIETLAHLELHDAGACVLVFVNDRIDEIDTRFETGLCAKTFRRWAKDFMNGYY